MIQLTVEIEASTTKIQFDGQGTMVIYRDLKQVPALDSEELLLYYKGREVQTIDYNQKSTKSLERSQSAGDHQCSLGY